MNRARIVCICVVVTLLVTPRIDAQFQTVVLVGGTLIDGTGRAPINDPVVVIEGPRIKAVGVRGQVSYPENARIISTEGRTILPGVIDAHIRVRDYMPPLFLRYGVTTVGDANNFTDWILLQRAEEILATSQGLCGDLKGQSPLAGFSSAVG